MLTGLAIHLFTALGAGCAFMALVAAVGEDFSRCFVWLGVAFAIDAVDGFLARRARVSQSVPFIDGALLDFVVDFLTYVFVPALAMARGGLLPLPLASLLAAAICVFSALYFADRRMKMKDNWFRGFPALWNVVALYAFAFRAPPWALAIIVVALIIAMFMPVAFVHPMRVRAWRRTTVCMTMVWSLCAVATIAEGLDASVYTRAGLALTAAYFLLLPLARRVGAVSPPS